MRLIKPGVLFVLFCGVLFVSCDDSITNNQVDQIVIPASDISYEKYIQPVFTVKCNNSTCHDNNSAAGGLVLTNWVAATRDPGVIFPGEPNSSRLVWSIEGTSTNPMPPIGYPPLTKNQINGIRTWIREGAKNN